MNTTSLSGHTSDAAAVNRLRKQLRRQAERTEPVYLLVDGPPPLRARLARVLERAERTAPEAHE